jgi:hypothetical protein
VVPKSDVIQGLVNDDDHGYEVLELTTLDRAMSSKKEGGSPEKGAVAGAASPWRMVDSAAASPMQSPDTRKKKGAAKADDAAAADKVCPAPPPFFYRLPRTCTTSPLHVLPVVPLHRPPRPPSRPIGSPRSTPCPS